MWSNADNGTCHACSADDAVISACRKQKFSILCDGGNDNFDKKYFGILVTLWDDRRREVVVRFLDIPVCNVATGEILFQALATAMETRPVNSRQPLKCETQHG